MLNMAICNTDQELFLTIGRKYEIRNTYYDKENNRIQYYIENDRHFLWYYDSKLFTTF